MAGWWATSSVPSIDPYRTIHESVGDKTMKQTISHTAYERIEDLLEP